MKKLRGIVTIIIIGFASLNVLGQIDSRINFDLIFKQEFILSNNWVLDNSIGEKILYDEKIKSIVQKSWINKNDNSIIVVLGKKSEGYYSPEYFQDREQIGQIAEKYGLKSGFNVENLAFYNKYGIDMGYIKFTAGKRFCEPFCVGEWTTISTSLKLKNEFNYFNFLTVILYRSNNSIKNSDSYREFKEWRDRLKIRNENVKRIEPSVVSYMTKLLDKHYITKIGTEVPSKEIVRDNNISKKEIGEFDKSIAKWTAPYNTFKIKSKSIGRKIVNGIFCYDFKNNSLIIKGTYKLITIGWNEINEIKDDDISYKLPLFKNGSWHLRISFKDVKKGKLDITFSNLNRNYGKILIMDFINKIRTINKLYFKIK